MACREDRERTDLTAHRLKVMNGWNWNVSSREAARQLQEELKAGRGGDKEQWLQEIRSFFNDSTASIISDLIQ